VYKRYDKMLRLDDFIRRYTPKYVKHYAVTDKQIEEAFIKLDKSDDIKRKFDCGACGSDSCYDMARKIVLGIDIPTNCIQKEKDSIHIDHEKIKQLSADNLSNIEIILKDISEIKELSDEICSSVASVNEAINKYSLMSKDINSISTQVNILSINASIEAARAGVHGKSFGVVADEVRALAGKSKKTVSETDVISEKAVKSVKLINRMIDNMSNAIVKAHSEITGVYNSTQSALKDFKNSE